MSNKMDFFFFFFFWLYRVACGILVHQPGIKFQPSAVEAPSPDHWTTREFSKMEYYLTIKRNRVLIHATTWMNLENIILY